LVVVRQNLAMKPIKKCDCHQCRPWFKRIAELKKSPGKFTTAAITFARRKIRQAQGL